MTDSVPLYLYKLVPSSTPVREPLLERLEVSEIDQKSGFIHLSTAFQVPGTLNTFFQDEPLVYVLRIPYGSVEHNIRWEPPEGKGGPRPDEGLFPVCIQMCTSRLMSPGGYANSITASLQRTQAWQGWGRKCCDLDEPRGLGDSAYAG